MKYIIDLPDDYNGGCVIVDMPINVKRSGTTYMRKKVLPEPYKQELEPLELKVGDYVMDTDGKEAYVLVPDYGKNDCVLIMADYSCPQIVHKSIVEKVLSQSDEVRRFIQLSAESLMQEVSE